MKLKREVRKILGRWEKAWLGLDYMTVNEICAFLRVVNGLFQRCGNRDAEKAGQGSL